MSPDRWHHSLRPSLPNLFIILPVLEQRAFANLSQVRGLGKVPRFDEGLILTAQNRKAAASPKKAVSAQKSTPKTKAVQPVKRTNVSKLLGTNILLVGALCVSTVIVATLAWRLMSTPVSIIAVTEDGQIIRPEPLAKAFVTDSRVLSFASEALRASFSHDFVNYRETFSDAKGRYYTTEGGRSFAKAIDPILNDLRERRLVMSAAPLKAPTLVLGPYLQGGRAVWEVQAPISLFLEGTQSRFAPQERLATLKIVRVSLTENPTGIGVDSIQLAPYIEK